MVDRAQLESWGNNNPVTIVTDNTSISRQLNLFDLWVDTTDQSLAPCLLNDHFWESWISCWMLRNVGEGFVCIDVGANMGYYTFLMNYLAGPTGTIHAFEPQERYLNLLAESMVQNDAEETVWLWPFAVSDRTGFTNLAIPGELGGSASIHEQNFDPKWGAQKNVQVQTITLDRVFKNKKVDFVKIDAEGAEHLIWRGMREVVDNNPNIVVCMEWTESNWGTEVTSDFIDEITSTMTITKINYDGYEEDVSRAELMAGGDWQMMVLRHK